MTDWKRQGRERVQMIFNMLKLTRRGICRCTRTATEQERGGRGSVREQCHEQRGELNGAIFLGNLLQFVPPTISSNLHRAREREGDGWSHPLLRLFYKQSYHSWTDADDGLCWRASLSLPLMLTSPLRAREISVGDPVRPTDRHLVPPTLRASLPLVCVHPLPLPPQTWQECLPGMSFSLPPA